jgi:hypothetical protein
MKLYFYCNRHDRRSFFTKAFIKGAERHEYDVEVRSILDPIPLEGDLVVVLGVRRNGSLERLKRARINYIYIDLAFNGDHHYRRASVNGFFPTHSLATLRQPDDRRLKFEWDILPWRESRPDQHVLIVTQSPYYHVAEGLPMPDDYARILKELLEHYTQRPIRWRAKPGSVATWFDQDDDFLPGRSLTADLVNCHALVTHGSGACIDGILTGVPCVITGEAVAKPISSVCWEDIENPRMADCGTRLQWLNNLAYCQWSIDEFGSGKALDFLKGLL